MRNSNIFSLDLLDGPKNLELEMYHSTIEIKELLIRNHKNSLRDEDLSRYIYGRPKDYIKSLLYCILSNHKRVEGLLNILLRHYNVSTIQLENIMLAVTRNLCGDNLRINHEIINRLVLGLTEDGKMKLLSILAVNFQNFVSLRRTAFQAIAKNHFTSQDLIPLPYSYYNELLDIDRGFKKKRSFVENLNSKFHLSEYIAYNGCNGFTVPLLNFFFMSEIRTQEELLFLLKGYKITRNGCYAAVLLPIITAHVWGLLKNGELHSILEFLIETHTNFFIQLLEYFLLSLSMCPQQIHVYFYNNIRGTLNNVVRPKNSSILLELLKSGIKIDKNVYFLIYIMITMPVNNKSDRAKKSSNRSTFDLYKELKAFKKSLISSI